MLDKDVLERIGLDKYLENGVIKTLDSSTKICVDVGLSENANNSGVWLHNDPDRCVIGIEPLKYNWDGLYGKHDWHPDRADDPTHGWPGIRLDKKSIVVNGKSVVGISNKFFGLECAIDNILSPEIKTFYHMEEEGSSSLLKPSKEHGSTIKQIDKVQCVSLNSIFDYIDWEKFQFIERLKIDCEGHDFEVLKSADKYFDKIIFISFEMSQHNEGHWEKHYNFEDAFHYMRSKGFDCIAYDAGDIYFVNSRFLGYAKVMHWKRHRGNVRHLYSNIPMPQLIVHPLTAQTYYNDFLEDE